MKLKNLFTTLGLTLAVDIGVAVGVGGQKVSNEVKADEVNTWMTNITFKASDYLSAFIDANSVMFRCGNDGEGGWKEVMMYSSGVDKIYNANVTFTDEFTFNRMQIKFTQGGADKYSVAYTISGSKASHLGAYDISAYGETAEEAWDGSNWRITLSGTNAPYFKYNDVIYNFEEDIPNAQYVCRDVEINDVGTGKYYIFRYAGGWNCTKGTLTTSTLNDYFSSKGMDLNDEWCIMDVPGTYDVFLKNNGDDDGIIEFKLHTDPNEVYIYYVLENNTPTNDYIYTWGGNEQFGSWPGTKITEVVGVQEVTGNGVLHFQGSETPKLIYKIPLKIGYPVGDEYFKFNNNDKLETAARPISGHNAYWWSGDANSLAGYAIDFLVMAEGYRNAAQDTSVCKISVEDATYIVNQYQSLGSDMQTTYVDCTKVYTHKRDKSAGDELVLYRDVIEQLAEIAGINLGSANRLPTNNEMSKTNTTMLLVVIISSAALVSISGFFLLKKKREN